MALSTSQQVRYSSGNYGKSLFWSTSEFFLLFFMTDIMGIPATIAGTIIFASLVWDGLTDPVMGYFADRRTLAGGTYRAFLIVGPPACAMSMVALFFDPPWPLTEKILYVTVACIAFRTLYTVFDVPHNALFARITEDSRERTRISGFRFFFSSLGGLTIALGVLPVLISDNPIEGGGRFLQFSVAAGVVASVVLWLSVKSNDEAFVGTSRDVVAERLPWRTYAKTLFSNRDALHLFLIAAVTAISMPLFSKFLIYLAKYQFQSEDLVSLFLATKTIGQIMAMPVGVWLATKLSKARANQFAHIGVAIIMIILMLDADRHVFSVTLLIFLAGFTIGAATMLVWAMAPDVVESLEAHQGLRLEAGFFSFLTLIQKSFIGLGAVVAGLVLDSSGFVPNLPAQADVLFAIKFVTFGMPFAGAVLCFLFLFGYRLDHDFHGKMVSDLNDANRDKSP